MTPLQTQVLLEREIIEALGHGNTTRVRELQSAYRGLHHRPPAQDAPVDEFARPDNGWRVILDESVRERLDEMLRRTERDEVECFRWLIGTLDAGCFHVTDVGALRTGSLGVVYPDATQALALFDELRGSGRGLVGAVHTHHAWTWRWDTLTPSLQDTRCWDQWARTFDAPHVGMILRGSTPHAEWEIGNRAVRPLEIGAWIATPYSVGGDRARVVYGTREAQPTRSADWRL